MVIPALLAVVAACSFCLGACGDDPAALAPFEPEVANVPDNFSLQATGVRNVSTTVRYTWLNSGTRATINHSTSTISGAARLLVKDGAGSIVYDRALEPSLNEPTEAGQAGDWSIEVTLARYTGTLNMRAQKL